MKIWKGAKKGYQPAPKPTPAPVGPKKMYVRHINTPEAIEASAAAPMRVPTKTSPISPLLTEPKRVRRTPVPQQLPKRAGVMSNAEMNKHIDDFALNRRRNDFRVAQNAQDRLLQQFAHAHVRAQTTADPNFYLRYFPSLADIPVPIGVPT